MAARLYLVPVIGTGVGKDARRAKYFTDGTVAIVSDLTMMDHGFEPWMVVTADLCRPITRSSPGSRTPSACRRI